MAAQLVHGERVGLRELDRPEFLAVVRAVVELRRARRSRARRRAA